MWAPPAKAGAEGKKPSRRLESAAAASRLKRLIPIAVAAFAALTVIMAAPAPAQNQPPRVVAVGDLHGDYQAWQAIARDARLIDARGRWAGGKTILVQMGDVTDRWADSLKIIRELQQLQRQAPRRGGKVIVLLGNHEAMNLLGDDRYTTAGEYAAFTDSGSAARRDRIYETSRDRLEAAYRAQDPKITPGQVRTAWMTEHPLGWIEHRIAWSPSGELGKWAMNNPAILKIGGTLFAHGGISAEYARQPIEAVNKRMAAAMAAGDDSPGSALTDPLGPLWYRGLVMNDLDADARRALARPPAPPLPGDQELTSVLSAYGAQRLVIGHTPNPRGIQISPDGRLARIDTAISRAYGGTPSWLEIIGDRMIPHTVARSP